MKLILWIGFTIIFQACTKETFHADPRDPRLPGYTEAGNNSAGAFINGNIWTVGQREFILGTLYPGAMQISCDTATGSSFIQIADGTLHKDNDEVEVTLGFYISGRCIQSGIDLFPLENAQVILDGVENYGYVVNSCFLCDTLKYGNGKLHIRHVETKDTCTIMAGTFGFFIESPEEIFTVYQGRFDFEICPHQIL